MLDLLGADMGIILAQQDGERRLEPNGVRKTDASSTPAVGLVAEWVAGFLGPTEAGSEALQRWTEASRVFGNVVGTALRIVVGGVVTAVRVIGGLVGSVWSLMRGDYGTAWERFKAIAECYPRPDRAQGYATWSWLACGGTAPSRRWRIGSTPPISIPIHRLSRCSPQTA